MHFLDVYYRYWFPHYVLRNFQEKKKFFMRLGRSYSLIWIYYQSIKVRWFLLGYLRHLVNYVNVNYDLILKYLLTYLHKERRTMTSRFVDRWQAARWELSVSTTRDRRSHNWNPDVTLASASLPELGHIVH